MAILTPKCFEWTGRHADGRVVRVVAPTSVEATRLAAQQLNEADRSKIAVELDVRDTR